MYVLGERRSRGFAIATRTHPRFITRDPFGGPYAPLRVYEAVLYSAGIKQPRVRAPAGNGWTKKVALISAAED